MIHGRNILIYADGVAIAGCKSCEIDADIDLIETSNPDDGESRTFIPGRKTWSAVTSGLIPVEGFAGYILSVGQTVTLLITEWGHASQQINGCLIGEAIIKTSKVTGTLSQLAQGTQMWQGTGALRFYADPIIHPVRPTDNTIVKNEVIMPEKHLWDKAPADKIPVT